MGEVFFKCLSLLFIYFILKDPLSQFGELIEEVYAQK